MTQLKSWLKENAALVYFLIAQAIAIGAAVLSMTAYMVRLEARVALLEDRGSPHLAEINRRLTVTEAETTAQGHRIDRIVEVLTRELGKKP